MTVRNICLGDGLSSPDASRVVGSSSRSLGELGITGHFYGGEGVLREEGGTYSVYGEPGSGLLSGVEAAAVEYTGATPIYL